MEHHVDFIMRHYLDMSRTATDPSVASRHRKEYKLAFLTTLLFAVKHDLLDEIEVGAYTQYLMGVDDVNNTYGESNLNRFFHDFETITTVLRRNNRVPNINSVEALVLDLESGDDIAIMERERISFTSLRMLYQVTSLMNLTSSKKHLSMIAC